MERQMILHRSQYPPEPPRPTFRPALNFSPSNLAYTFHEPDDVEKAMIRHSSSYQPFDSGYSTPKSSFLASLPSKHFPSLKNIDQLPGPPLPSKRYNRYIRHLRLTVFTVYRRLFSFTFIMNFLGLLLLVGKNEIQNISLNDLATAASTNFLVSILFRQDFCVNFLFRTAWLVSWSVPLRIRRLIAHVYAYGGIHSGAAVAGTMWFFTFTILMAIRFVSLHTLTSPVFILTGVIFAVLIFILALACPPLRARYHNTFEISHRFLGWVSILLLWVQVILLAHHATESSSASFATMLIRQPTFWNLIFITMMIIIPWLHLRKWTFTAERLSSHALRLHFTRPVHRFSCLSISSSPLKEWHPFATFPSTDRNEPGASLIISAAGDWTRFIINNSSPTMAFWVKGSPKAGVLSLSCIFKRVVILTTGSGVGPSLSSMLDRPKDQFCRLIWSTRQPIETFGRNIEKEVENADPEAVIIDTDKMSRPNLVDVAWKVYRETKAEAIFVLSNRTVTRKVVYGLESRGVLAYGPIWDS